MEILKGISSTVKFPGYGEEAPTFSKAPTVKVTRDSDGKEVGEELKVTRTPEDEEKALEYWSFELTGAQVSEVDLLTATWTDGASTAEQKVEVVGAYVCSTALIKAKHGGSPSTEELQAAREIATKEIESACGMAMRPRYAKDQLDGKGTTRLVLKHRNALRVIRVVVGETALSEAELEDLTVDPIGKLKREATWPRGESNIEVAYAHGFQGLQDAVYPVRDYAAYLLTNAPNDWQGRATSFTNEMGTRYNLITPGVRGMRFPLPTVNSFVSQFSAPLVG